MNGAKIFKEWHWGIPHAIEVEWDDDDLPRYLVEAGRLKEIHYRPLQSNPKRRDKIIKLPKAQANLSHVTFDPEHKHQRLYLLLDPKTRKEMRTKLYKGNPSPLYSLYDVSEMVGGRHAVDDYPKILGKIVGILTDIVYATAKKGDGMSFYIHKMGEESGIVPALVVDAKGRLFIVGGNYTAPTPGITD